MEYEPDAIETKWRSRWQEEGWYEADPDADGPSRYITVAYPYPNGAMHVGHVRTYTVPDVFARFRRMQGENVLFPMAWHVTGTPIIGAVERLQNREAEQMRILTEVFEVPEADLEELETPMGFARYFIENSYKKAMQGLGLSIDWRREFTTNDNAYSEFISWQYETLFDRDLLVEDSHPVNFCTNEEQPVTTHDILEGEEAEFQDYTLIKFESGDHIIPMATLRPETVRGVTNAFVDPEATYVEATVDGEGWIVSEAAAEKLSLQQRDVRVGRSFPGRELVGQRVTNPVTGDPLPILPATFVEADNATGVVMSVPAHSPDDYVALRAVQDDPEALEHYGLDPADVTSIEPIGIIDVDGYGTWPARDVVESNDITDQNDPALEDVTADLYNTEYHEGRLTDIYDEFAGEVIEDVRDELRAHYREQGAFDAMYEFNETVICRCGGRVEVAEQDTWFLDYNDETWKDKTRRALADLETRPENTRDQYEHTIDWLEEWPCIRNYGLGTRLPWDEDFVIEPLSDSTIYMAYYTIAHRLDELDVEVDREFFREVFEAEDPSPAAAALREEFEEWYPVNVRFSASELIQNHLTFYLYHHAELFDEANWPEGITTMGLGQVKGKSMSSSAGRVVLADKTVEEYGADTVRFFLLNSAEPWQDFDWRPGPVSDTRDQLARFWRRSCQLIESKAGEEELEHIDKWLLDRLDRTIETVTEALDNYETRAASQAAFYQLEDDLRWYRRRTDTDRAGAIWTRKQVLETRLRLLTPFVPYLANELHDRLTGTPAEKAAWPTPDPDRRQAGLDASEELLKTLVEDIQSIVEVTGADPDRIRITTAADWKGDILETVLDADELTMGPLMDELMSQERFRDRGGAVQTTVEELIDLVRDRSRSTLSKLATVDEARVIEEAESFLAAEFDAEIHVNREDEKAADESDALPGRPAIHLE